jgi:hypothetical protein
MSGTGHTKHKIKLFRWVDGILHTVEKFFDKLEDAITSTKDSDAQSYKIYDRNGELCHSGTIHHKEKEHDHKHHHHDDDDGNHYA